MDNSRIKSLLNLLYQNSNLNLIELGNLLNITRQTASKYLKILNNTAIEEKFTLKNPNIYGIRTFFVEIKTNPEEPEIVTELKRIKNTKSIDGIIGQNSLMVKFGVNSNQEFMDVLQSLDKIISGSRFQHYRITECLNTFKDAGFIFSTNSDTEKSVYNTIRLKPKFIQETDYPFKFYLQIVPKNMAECNNVAKEILAYNENIIELYRTGQEFSLLAVIRTKDIPEYRAIIESIYKTKKIQDTVSILAIDEKMPAIFKPFRD